MPTVSGRSYESIGIDSTVVSYAPPLAKFPSDPGAFEFWWKALYYVFELRSPYDLEPPSPFPSTEPLERYCEAAKDMASSAALVYGSEVAVHVRRGEDGAQVETITGGSMPDAGSPTQLISMFAYGSLIHWWDKREQLSRQQADEFGGPTDQLRFLEAIAGLAYLYMGFAVIVARCIGRGGEFA